MTSLEGKQMIIPLTKGGLIVCLIKKKKKHEKLTQTPVWQSSDKWEEVAGTVAAVQSLR